ncbi:hypothetical protein [Kribbella solani]|uniref:hypothetical protein n=1 Tax=Kribbella solani TaxID=236067 RepID=UPI0029B78A73|nr:hypothetical protein [Kribbella solani]MDX2972368.1 hypothetical protein [Kribbella solani]
MAIVLCVLWMFVRNDTYYRRSPSNARREIEETLRSVDSAGQQVYINIADRGCDTGSSVGLATVVHCEIVGDKYFLNSGSPEADLHSIDATLTSHNWRRQVQDGTMPGLPYQDEDGREAADIVYYKDESDHAVRQLIESHIIPDLGPSDYIYGIHAEATYWSCSDISIFKLPCIVPAWYKKASD